MAKVSKYFFSYKLNCIFVTAKLSIYGAANGIEELILTLYTFINH